MLTVMLVPGTELYRQWRSGSFELPEPLELLGELRQVIVNTNGLSRCVRQWIVAVWPTMMAGTTTLTISTPSGARARQ